ncbi:hypothetical protein GKC28_21270 [Leisingera sp. ANG59]|nr:hypothetical protein [Leisingera sp. ANG59]
MPGTDALRKAVRQSGFSCCRARREKFKKNAHFYNGNSRMLGFILVLPGNLAILAGSRSFDLLKKDHSLGNQA